MRRALILAALVAGALAPAADARPSLVVQASASGIVVGDQMRLTVECSAADVKNIHFGLSQCSVGPVAADTYCGFECPGEAFAYATGTAPAGAYELCVRAYSWGTYAQHFARCVPLDPTTHTAVITG